MHLSSDLYYDFGVSKVQCMYLNFIFCLETLFMAVIQLKLQNVRSNCGSKMMNSLIGLHRISAVSMNKFKIIQNVSSKIS